MRSSRCSSDALSGSGDPRRGGAVDCRRPARGAADARPDPRGPGRALLRSRPSTASTSKALVDRARQRIKAAAVARRDLRAAGRRLSRPAAIRTPCSCRRSASRTCDYGWTWRYVGDRALVDYVDDDGDARDRQGLRVGDTVVEVAGYPLTRTNHRTVRYLLTVAAAAAAARRHGRARWHPPHADDRGADPQAPGAHRPRQRASIATSPRCRRRWPTRRARSRSRSGSRDGVLYWRLTDFFDDAPTIRKSRRAAAQARQPRHPRPARQPGGSVGVLLRIAGLLRAARDVPVVRIAGRGEPGEHARHRGRRPRPFAGTVVVLVDARSGSSAEILARFLQQRGARVVGDRTIGAVTRRRPAQARRRRRRHQGVVRGCSSPSPTC